MNSCKKNEPERRSGCPQKNRNGVPVRSGPTVTYCSRNDATDHDARRKVCISKLRAVKERFPFSTSGLPGRRPVTPRACGARKKAPGRAVYDKFVNVWIITFASALAIRPRCHQRPCRQCAAQVGRAASAVAPVPFVNRMTVSKSAILHHLPNFYTLRVDILRNLFCSSLPITPMNHENFHGNRSARFSEIRNTDRQTDRQTDAAAL